MRAIIASLLTSCFTIISMGAALAQSCALPSGRNYPLLGANYAHFRVTQPVSCPPLEHLRNAGILDGYQDPGTRSTVTGQLNEMRRSGLSSLRMIIWHRSIIGNPHWGIIPSIGGRMDPQHGRNLQEFISDVARAGFRRLTIAFGPQQPNSPKCTRNKPINCFNPASLDEDIAFALDVRRVAKLGAPASLELRFDLMNEACVPPSQQPAAGILHNYLVTLLRRYAAAYGTADVTLSCSVAPRQPVEVGIAGVEMLLGVFHDAQVQPPALDFHVYSQDPGQIEMLLNRLAQVLMPLGIKLVIGESLYDNPVQADVFARFVDQHPGFVEEIDSWPVLRPDRCHITVPPPYNACPLASAVAHYAH